MNVYYPSLSAPVLSVSSVATRLLAAVLVVIPTLALFSGASVTVMFLWLSLLLLVVTWRAQPWRSIPSSSVVFLAVAVCWALIACAWTPTKIEHAIGSALSVISLAAIGLLSLGAAAALQADQRMWVRRGLLVGIAIAIVALVVEVAFGYPLTCFFRDTDSAAATSLVSRGSVLLILLFWPVMAVLSQVQGVVLLVFMVIVIAATGKYAVTLAIALAAITFLARNFAVRWMRGLMVAWVLSAPLLGLILPSPEAAGRGGLFNSALHRVVIWHFTTDRIAEHPMLGWGMDASRSMVGGDDETIVRVAGDNEPHRYPNLPLHPHNGALQVWLELGLPGVLLLGALLWNMGKRIQAGNYASARNAALVSAFTIGCLSYGLWQSWWQSSLWLTVVLFAAVTKMKSDSVSGSSGL